MEISSSPPLPISLSPRRSCDSSTSLEFEFNPCFPSPTALPSADELFFGGVILPLRLLPTHHHNSDSDPVPPSDPDPHPNPLYSSSNANPDFISDPQHTHSEPGPGPSPPLVSVSDPSPSILSAGITASKRWRDIFKKSPTEETKDKHKEKKKDRKNGGSGARGGNSAELNINLWPFSRSRSAGNNAAGRPRSAVAARKVSSAPCSRSNSAGESKSRRWPSSPARPGSAGVHLGRTSPVWQLPRTVSSRAEKGKDSTEGNRRSKAVKGSTSATGGGGKARVLTLNVPMCIGYRHHLSCRSDETSAIGSGGGGTGDSGRQNGAVTGAGGGGGGGSRNVGGGNLFNLRSLFSKKVY